MHASGKDKNQEGRTVMQRCAQAVRKVPVDLATQDFCLVLPRALSKTLHPPFFKFRAGNR